MKQLAYLGILLVATACGGGGGGGGTDNTTPVPPPVPPTESEIIQQLLDGCGIEGTQEFQNLFDLLVGFFAPGTPAPAFQITGTNILQTSFDWGLDLSSPPDMVNDLTGTTAIRDALGNPTLGGISGAALLQVLGGDLNALATLLASVDPGTRLVTTFTGAAPSNPATGTIAGSITIVMGDMGAFDTSSGDVTTTTGQDCTSTLTWTDLDLSSVNAAGALPSGTMTIEVTTASDMLDGTITLDGTSTALIDVSRNGGPIESYSLDLNTNTLSPL